MTFNRTQLALALFVSLISASCSKDPAYPDAGAAKSKSKSNTFASDTPAAGATPAPTRPAVTIIPMGEDDPAVTPLAPPVVGPVAPATPSVSPFGTLTIRDITAFIIPRHTSRPTPETEDPVNVEFAAFLTRCYGDNQFYCNENTAFLLDHLSDN